MWHGYFLSWGGGVRGMGAVVGHASLVRGCKLKSWPLFPKPQEMVCLTLKLSTQCLIYGRVYLILELALWISIPCRGE